MNASVPDPDFVARIDRLLAQMELEIPSLGQMRQVPIDMIAAAVEREAAPAWTQTVESLGCPLGLLEPSDYFLQAALQAIAARNRWVPVVSG